MAIRIRLLGALDIESDGVRAPLPARKTEALLAILALRPGVAFGRERLIAWLWPDVLEAQGRTSLRQALGHLRKALSSEAIVSDADRVHLDPRAVWVDTAEVERVLQSPPTDRERLLDLWRGPLLDGMAAVEDPFNDWLSAERDGLEQRVASALEECLAAVSGARRFERALAVGQRLLEIEPTRESVHRALMRLFVERGDRAAALRQYERCRDCLQRVFRVAPSTETESLRRSISEPVAASPDASPEERQGDGRLTLAIIPFEASPVLPSAPGARVGGDARLLADALTEDVSIELSRFRQLAVVAQRSIAELTARGKTSEEVARETGARLLLSGSVRVASERARVTATLLDATTRLQLWSERWDVPHDDLFGAVDRLTRSVVGALALRIDEARLGLARRRPRERLEVYECWLRGLECLRRGSPESDEEARGYFEQALALSPGFARAYSGISLSHFNDWSCQAWERWDERERLAFDSAKKAVELDDRDHVTHSILARIYVYRRRFAEGERHLEHALSLNSSDADMLMQAAVAFVQLGEAGRAWQLAESALGMSTRHPDWYYGCAAWPLFMARRPEETIAMAERAPDTLVDTRALLAAANAHLGHASSARDHAERFTAEICRKITRGRHPEPGEAARWLMHVNPLKRPEDVEYLLVGLEMAGLSRPEGLTPLRAGS